MRKRPFVIGGIRGEIREKKKDYWESGDLKDKEERRRGGGHWR